MQCQRLKTYMETGRVIFLSAKSIRPNPSQPRKGFRQDSLEELANSIRQHGILQPLSVRRMEGNSFELIAGERRLRAAQMAGLTDIPCIIMTMDDKESGMAALVENLQRQDLDYIEEAKGICRLTEKWGISQEQASAILGRSQSAVANKLRLLKHSAAVREALRQSELTERHARALLKLPDERQKLAAIEAISKANMNVAKAEQYIDSLLLRPQAKERKPDVNAFLRNLTTALSKMQQSGVSAVSERRETEKEIVVTLTFPK